MTTKTVIDLHVSIDVIMTDSMDFAALTGGAFVGAVGLLKDRGFLPADHNTPAEAAVMVSRELIKQLTADELTALLHHELGHILNKDLQTVTTDPKEALTREMLADAQGVRYTDIKVMRSLLKKVTSFRFAAMKATGRKETFMEKLAFSLVMFARKVNLGVTAKKYGMDTKLSKEYTVLGACTLVGAAVAAIKG